MYFEKLKSKVYNSFNDIGLSISNVELTRLEVTEKNKKTNVGLTKKTLQTTLQNLSSTMCQSCLTFI